MPQAALRSHSSFPVATKTEMYRRAPAAIWGRAVLNAFRARLTRPLEINVAIDAMVTSWFGIREGGGIYFQVTIVSATIHNAIA